MKAHIRYAKEFGESPITRWLRDDPARPSTKPTISFPKPGPTLQGYRRYYVEMDGFTFYFAELEELAYCIEVLSQKVLPPSQPNQHWLSRLPGWTKSWRFRQKAVKGLQTALEQFLKSPDDAAGIRDPKDQVIEKSRRQWQGLKHAEKKKRKRNADEQAAAVSSSPKKRRVLRRLLLRPSK